MIQWIRPLRRAAGSSIVFEDWYNLGNGFLTMQEFKSAADAFRQALKLKPDYAPAWNNLGTLEGMLGNTKAALQDYQRASELGDPLGGGNYARVQNAIAAAQQSRARRHLGRDGGAGVGDRQQHIGTGHHSTGNPARRDAAWAAAAGG